MPKQAPISCRGIFEVYDTQLFYEHGTMIIVFSCSLFYAMHQDREDDGHELSAGDQFEIDGRHLFLGTLGY